jgi:mRNA interferase MazF
MNLPRRGEVWWCEVPEIGRRPVVVLSRDAAIAARRRTILAPCTTTIRALPTEVPLRPGTDPVPRRCAVNLDSVQDAPVALLVDRLGRLDDARMREICAALSVAVGCA